LAAKDADKLITELVPRSHGQLLQDVVCLLVSEKREGFFVEVGVGDGEKYSNTLMLERDYGWNGILVEPAQRFHGSIARRRTALLDRRAAGTQDGATVEFEEDDGFGELSHVVKGTVPSGRGSRYLVELVRLDTLLDQYRAPPVIDFLSIDTEGSELDVLSGFDMRRRRCRFISIEHNFERARLREIKRRLATFGYRQILPELSQFDAWFIANELGADYLA
jgi:FkbM family methyltransferase